MRLLRHTARTIPTPAQAEVAIRTNPRLYRPEILATFREEVRK